MKKIAKTALNWGCPQKKKYKQIFTKFYVPPGLPEGYVPFGVDTGSGHAPGTAWYRPLTHCSFTAFFKACLTSALTLLLNTIARWVSLASYSLAASVDALADVCSVRSACMLGRSCILSAKW